MFPFHVEPGFLRDGGSVGKGIGSLVESSQDMVKVSFLWGGAGVDELVNGVEEFEVVRKKMVIVWVVQASDDELQVPKEGCRVFPVFLGC